MYLVYQSIKETVFHTNFDFSSTHSVDERILSNHMHVFETKERAIYELRKQIEVHKDGYSLDKEHSTDSHLIFKHQNRSKYETHVYMVDLEKNRMLTHDLGNFQFMHREIEDNEPFVYDYFSVSKDMVRQLMADNTMKLFAIGGIIRMKIDKDNIDFGKMDQEAYVFPTNGCVEDASIQLLFNNSDISYDNNMWTPVTLSNDEVEDLLYLAKVQSEQKELRREKVVNEPNEPEHINDCDEYEL